MADRRRVVTPVPGDRKRGWRAWLHAALLRIAEGIERVGHGLRYASIGVLRFDAFVQASRDEYNHYRTTDPEALSGLLWWEREIFARFVAPGDRLLVIGCGTGRDVLALAAAGHDVVGLDCLPEPLATAQRLLDATGHRATLFEGALDEGDSAPGLFDVVIFSDHVYSLIPLAARRHLALTRARTLLAPGGRIIVSYHETPFEQPQRGLVLARWAAAVTRSGWRLEHHDVVKTRGPKGSVMQYTHLFTPTAFDDEMHAAGLRIVYRRAPAVPPVAVLVSEDSGL